MNANTWSVYLINYTSIHPKISGFMFMHFNLAAPLQSDLRKSPIAGVYTETKELMPINKNLCQYSCPSKETMSLCGDFKNIGHCYDIIDLIQVTIDFIIMNLIACRIK